MSFILSKLINLAGNITGILKIANGGTNSNTSLNNNRFVISSSGKIVEASAVTASKVVVSDSNGLPTAASTSTTQVNYLSSATGTTGTTNTNIVFSTSPTLVAPILGTPASGNLSNCTNYPAATNSSAGTITAQAQTTFTATFTQAGGYSQPVTVSATLLGNVAILEIPSFNGTTTASSTIVSGATDVPSTYRPISAQYNPILVAINAGTVQMGAIAVSTGGQITVFSTVGGGPFLTGSTNAGLSTPGGTAIVVYHTS